MKCFIRCVVLVPVIIFVASAAPYAASSDLGDATETDTKAKVDALKVLRQRYANTGIRSYKLKQMPPAEDLAKDLGEDGVFKSIGAEKPYKRAFMHLWRLAHHLQTHPDADLKKRVLRSVLYYGKLETSLPNIYTRFHDSCFAIPQSAVNIYFYLFEDMVRVEAKKTNDPLLVNAHKMIQTLAMQSWTQPYRDDETDKDVVQVARFRGHVWWVGGNGIAYRPVFPTALLMNSVPMVDVMAEVVKKSLSQVSQTTYDKAFWDEGFTADGAGWGHGKQCLVWGYPIDGALSALGILGELKGTPWAASLDRDNLDAVLTYIRGSSWYFYKGHIPPCVDRNNMNYNGLKCSTIRSRRLAEALLRDWAPSMTEAERAELALFIKQTEDMGAYLDMAGQPSGWYSGSRWFYNNDDLIAKNRDWYVLINMASKRCDGLESANHMAAGYNFFTADGQTLFQRNGEEYLRAIGAWNLTAVPGVTARQGEERLKSIKNWKGFKSLHNFAAGATRGGMNACAGFIFEKQDGSWKDGKRPRKLKNPTLYDVTATKGYFLLGDALICLGAGVTNKNPKLPGTVWTTIDQTHWRGSVHGMSSGTEFSSSPGDKPVSLQLKPEGISVSEKISWVSQEGGFSYGILYDQTPHPVHLSLERRKTKWEKLSVANRKVKDLPRKEDILQLWIDHGRQVKDGRYGYVVWLGKGTPPARQDFRVLANTPGLQAVTDGKGITEAVFYDAENELDAGAWRLKVSSPCAVMVEENVDDQTLITVSDGLMDPSLKNITVSMARNAEGAKEDKAVWKSVKINLPRGKHCGQPVTKPFTK